MPPTVCHLDVHPHNLFDGDGVDDTVLVDWAFVGIGALGEDPANLIVDAVATWAPATSFLLRMADEARRSPR